MRVDFSSQDYFRNPAAAIEKLRSAGPVVEVRFPILGRYARQLPLAVICELLGLPVADRAKFTAWAGTFTRFTQRHRVLQHDSEDCRNFFAMKRYLEKQLDVARERGGEGLIAELVRVEKDGGQISRNEMVSMLFLLLFAGHETTTHLISGSVHELLKNPRLRDWLEKDWSRASLAVEEFVRFISPVQFTSRATCARTSSSAA
jgi:cytochrome P450 PksS